MVELFEARLKTSPLWAGQLRNNPFAFHVRYYWSRANGGIRHQLLETPGPRDPIPEQDAAPSQPPPRPTLRQRAIATSRALLSQRSRNRALDLLPLLRCPGCLGEVLVRQPESLMCATCHTSYRRTDRLVDLTPAAAPRS